MANTDAMEMVETREDRAIRRGAQIDELAARVTRLAGVAAIAALVLEHGRKNFEQLLATLSIDVPGLAGTLASVATLSMITLTLMQAYSVTALLGQRLREMKPKKNLVARIAYPVAAFLVIIGNALVFSVIYSLIAE
ncbi:MAG: hypothetical protein Q4G22_10475 [Paracoccus sp. (in: a-proteobacteria)]|uniref:hypothetical protein n=1 Tax=Paracoccus sp. TaxID=267 RepID=UPI0026E09BA8|nr:hypothetical protein [Paracoccus sp. (in: a-proteobacteria)]MDO5632250.1 hypothetical protein [Paracoccus sp. (in: a-proteobacteria)]